MISFSRIYAMIYRHLISLFRDPIRLADAVYYPFLDIMLFGFLGIWSHGDQANADMFLISLLASISCWYLVYRSALEISRNLLIDIWDDSIISVLTTPISITELSFALMFLGIIQALITFIYTSCLIWLIFSKNIFSLYLIMAPYLPLFLAFGWIIGLLTAALIFRFGKSVEFTAWALPWFFSIFSGAFYPTNLFPAWVQNATNILPLKFLFRSMRESIKINASQFISQDYIIALITIIVYLIFTFWFLFFMVKKARNKGLNNLV
ncbi:MAG: ABC transporter permease [Novosphingobium sp.]|nr:ABC transporter permease [Novosphingobium sp.]